MQQAGNVNLSVENAWRCRSVLQCCEQLKALISVYERVFEMEKFDLPDQRYLQAILANQQVLFFVAEHQNGQVLGGLTAYIMPSVYYAAAEVYIYDLAIEVS